MKYKRFTKEEIAKDAIEVNTCCLLSRGFCGQSECSQHPDCPFNGKCVSWDEFQWWAQNYLKKMETIKEVENL